MNFTEYHKILPQKEPFMFIDGIVGFDKELKVLTAYKQFKSDEYFLRGHFPDAPLVPGVILIEAMSQASILCGYYSNNSTLEDTHYAEHLVFDVSIKFRNKCLPDEIIMLYSNLVGIFQNVSIFKVKALDANNKILASGEIRGVAKIRVVPKT
jgi:3-hydroxyacyl-[acyl-carrier-protein] dehydratase